MGLADYLSRLLENFDNRNSLENLRKKFKDKFDIMEMHMPIDYDKRHDPKAGYIDIPKKDNLSRNSVEKLVSEFYKDLGFSMTKRSYDDLKFMRGNREYIIKIIESGKQYCLDIDFSDIQKL